MEKLRRPYCVGTALVLWIGILILTIVQIISEIVVSVLHSQTLTNVISDDLTAHLGTAQNQVQNQANNAGAGYSSAEIHTMAVALPFMAIFVEILLVAVFSIIIWRMSRGRKWARVVLIFIGCYMAVQGISAIIMAFQDNTSSFSIIAYYLSKDSSAAGGNVFSFVILCIVILEGIMAVPALSQMRKPEADEWFNAIAEQRHPPTPPTAMPPMPPLPPVPPNGPRSH